MKRDLTALQQENGFANQIIPIKFLPKPSVSASLQGILITGSGDFINDNLRLLNSPFQKLTVKDLILGVNLKQSKAVSKACATIIR